VRRRRRERPILPESWLTWPAAAAGLSCNIWGNLKPGRQPRDDRTHVGSALYSTYVYAASERERERERKRERERER
jgi:hypothetical protein